MIIQYEQLDSIYLSSTTLCSLYLLVVDHGTIICQTVCTQVNSARLLWFLFIRYDFALVLE